MSTLNFPTNPTVGDTWTVGNKIYTWSGSAWLVSGTISAVIENIIATTLRVISTANAVSSTTGALIVDGGASIKKDLWVVGDIYKNGTLLELQGVSSATSISNGSPGELLYQISTSTTGFVPVAPVGYVLQSNGLFGPEWVPLEDIAASSLLSTTNLRGGGPGQIPYQEFTSSTQFIATGTSGFVLVSNGTNAPEFIDPSLIVIGNSNNAENLLNGIQGAIPIQSATSTTAFISPGVAGYLLQSQGNTSTFVNTATIVVGYAISATQWTTARTISLDGDLTGSISINGTSDLTFTATLKPNIVELGVDTTGTYVGAAYTFGFGVTGQSTGAGTTFNVGINSTSSKTANTLVYRDANGAFEADIIGNITTASNIASGSPGELIYQIETGQTGFISTGTEGDVLVTRGSTGPVYQNTLTLSGTTSSTNTTTGALVVSGGVGIGENLNVGGNLIIKGTSVFEDSVTFVGSSTFIYTTNTVYTDNLINLHIPQNGSPTDHEWSTDDGQDIGHIYHYYDTVDKNAALILANDSKYLEWYSDGDESGAIFTGTSYGTFKTGSIELVNTTTSNSTDTGALTIVGGVGVGGDLHVGGIIYGDVVGLISNALEVNTVEQSNSSTYYPTFVNSNNTTATSESLYTTSSFNINPATGDVYIGGRILTSVFPQSDYLLIGRSDSQIPGNFGISLGYNIGSIGNYSVAIGFEASRYGSGSNNFIVGQFAGYGSAGNSYSDSILLGNSAGYSLNDGGENIFIGKAAGVITTSGYGNVYIGITSGNDANGNQNVYIGYGSGYNMTTGSNNVIIGSYTGNSGGLDIRGLNDNVVISDGNGIIKISFNSAGDGKIWSGTNSTSTSTGALVVSGGVGIGGSLYVGGIFSATGSITGLGNLSITDSGTIGSATDSTDTSTGALVVTGGIGVGKKLNVGGDVKIYSTTSAISTTTGALQVEGGASVKGNVWIGESLTIGPDISDQLVSTIYSNNLILANYTSPVITTTDPIAIDSYIATEYRTARYTVQIYDDSKIHISEIMLSHNDTTAFFSEYGIVTSNGELGSFSADLSGGSVTLTFTPSVVSSMTIKIIRLGITA